MKPSTRIEVIDRESIVAMPLRLPAVYVPHVVLIGVIGLLWTVDGLFELGAWIVSAI